jgi:hypothetical protein
MLFVTTLMAIIKIFINLIIHAGLIKEATKRIKYCDQFPLIFKWQKVCDFDVPRQVLFFVNAMGNIFIPNNFLSPGNQQEFVLW